MTKRPPKPTGLDAWAATPKTRRGGPPSDFDRPQIRELIERYVSMVMEGKTVRSAAEFAAWLRAEHGVTSGDNTVQAWVRKVRESRGKR
jgi:transposase